MKAKNNSNTTQRVALLGILASLALIFSYVEVLIPFQFGIPGIKLGLANLVVVVALYTMSTKDALTVAVLKIFLSGLLFGNGASMIYSLCGGLLSFAVMFAAQRWNQLSPTGVSVLGGVSHNIGQLAIAMVVTKTLLLSYYLPMLLLAGVVTGFLIGLVAGRVLTLLHRSENGK